MADQVVDQVVGQVADRAAEDLTVGDLGVAGLVAEDLAVAEETGPEAGPE